MQELTDCLGSPLPRVFATRVTIPQVRDPVAWALGLIRANSGQARLQARDKPARDDPAETGSIVHLDAGDAGNVEHFARGIGTGHPMHGSLDLLQFGTDGGTLRDGADWVWQIANHYFVRALQARNPLGFYIKATLWLSAGEHRYAAHCDLADGFLIHVCGRKRVRVWPVPERQRAEHVFNHEDFAGRMSSEPLEVELAPGQILFIPAGAMHDVVAHKAGPAVSVSLHMGSPYPLLTLRDELNAMLGREDIAVPAHMQSREKFDIYVFEPARFGGDREHLPEALVEVLLAVLNSGTLGREALRQLLDRWWSESIAAPHYQSPYP